MFSRSLFLLLSLLSLSTSSPLSMSKLERIVGGEPARLVDFPWQVSLRNVFLGFSHFCGGIIVDEQWVLTAGHCVDGLDALLIQVVAGQRFLDIPWTSTQLSIPFKVIVHPDYDAFTNDVALLKLSLPFRSTDFVRAATLNWQEELEEGSKCNVTGWGVTHEDSILPSFVLRKAAVDVVSYETCRDNYEGVIGIEEDNMLCAAADGKDSCGGDSGGPLTCSVEGERVVAGVVSFGYGCARPDFPGVYAKVANFVDWIKQTIEEN